ncbi:hypothetical protein [Ornithinibacillus bavariensis]|uniref:hypothetical protein n=1 Tax=Ornithinibacillus bavariensis TaxID=545502 RepID=UPI000ED8FF93|nr:hypothetical protein [Ornithinibacillus sp.]
MEVYIVLTHTGTLFTRFIRLFTKQPLNHASIAFTKELDETFSFGRKKPTNPFIGGFVKEDLKGQLFRNADCAIYRCSISRSQYERMQRFVQAIENNQCEYKYNFIGLLGVLFNRTIDLKKSYFCSQFVAAVLSNGGITIKNKPECLVKPSDFMDSHQFQMVYEGKLTRFLEQQGKNKEVLTGKKRFYLLPS